MFFNFFIVAGASIDHIRMYVIQMAAIEVIFWFFVQLRLKTMSYTGSISLFMQKKMLHSTYEAANKLYQHTDTYHTNICSKFFQ